MPFLALVFAVLAVLVIGGIVAGLLLVGAGGWAIYDAFQLTRRTKRAQAAPVATANSAAIGLARLSGRAVVRSPWIAPFSQRPCVYLRVDVLVPGPRRQGWT